MNLRKQRKDRDFFLRKAHEAAYEYSPSGPLSVSLNPKAFGESIGFDEPTTERIVADLVSEGYASSSIGLGVLFVTSEGLSYLTSIEAEQSTATTELELQNMTKRIDPIPSEVMENICRVIADTKSGLTGTEISRLLAEAMIPDTDPTLSKWQRLFNAFANYQNAQQCSNNILTFLAKAMEPVRYVDKRELFRSRLNELNKRLGFIGLKLSENAKYIAVPKSSTLTDPLTDNDDAVTNTYDVAISFAGEDRNVADEIANLLKREGLNVFYDKYEQATLWGKDLYEHLQVVYKDQSRYCLMLISQHYKEKQWTSHERKAAQARAFTESKEYILPLRLDDTVIPGINQTVGYIDYRQTSAEEVTQLLIEKLK